jgi:putative flavoprotein involved in K+ transport
MGVVLAGRVDGVSGGRVSFADDLADSVAFGDARLAAVRRLLRDKFGDRAPDLPEPEPFVADAPRHADLADLGAVVFTAGFRPDYSRWVHFPVLDDHGFPVTADDLSTAVPGLYFCGVHFLRNRRSSLLWGVGDDARIVAATIAQRLRGAAGTAGTGR